MNPADVGIQRMNDRLALAAHEPATWGWLTISIVALLIYVYAAHALTRHAGGGDLEGWLALVFGGLAIWIVFGWMVELFTFDARGHLSFFLGWQAPIALAFCVAAAWGLMRVQDPHRTAAGSARTGTGARSTGQWEDTKISRR